MNSLALERVARAGPRAGLRIEPGQALTEAAVLEFFASSDILNQI